MDFCGTLGKLLHHFLLMLRRLGHFIVVHHLRRGKVELIGGLDVRRLFPERHKLREVEKLCKARPRPVAGSLRGQLDGRGGFSKGAGPIIKVGQMVPLEHIVLKVAHHGVKLGHGIAHRRSGGKYHAFSSGQLIQIAAF